MAKHYDKDTTVQPRTGWCSRVSAPRLFFREWAPPHPRATVLVIHGFGEHSGRYAELAEYLADANLLTLIPDLRGFGKSAGSRGFVSVWSEYLDDIHALMEQQSAAQPLLLLGHSMGGLIAIELVLRGGLKFATAVLTSPLLALSMSVPHWKLVCGAWASKFLPRLTLSSGVAPKFLTHDPEKLEQVEHDPLCVTKATARWFSEMNKARCRVMNAAPEFRLPCLIIHAGDDHITQPEASRAFLERTQNPDNQYRLRPGEYHEVLNEVNRLEVMQQIRDWLLASINR